MSFDASTSGTSAARSLAGNDVTSAVSSTGASRADRRSSAAAFGIEAAGGGGGSAAEVRAAASASPTRSESETESDRVTPGQLYQPTDGLVWRVMPACARLSLGRLLVADSGGALTFAVGTAAAAVVVDAGGAVSAGLVDGRAGPETEQDQHLGAGAVGAGGLRNRAAVGGLRGGDRGVDVAGRRRCDRGRRGRARARRSRRAGRRHGPGWAPASPAAQRLGDVRVVAGYRGRTVGLEAAAPKL